MKKTNTGKKIAGIVGITAATVLAAYLAYDKKGTEKKYNQVKKWMWSAKNDLMKKVKTFKKLDRQVYYDAVDQIVTKYSQVKGVEMPEIKSAVHDLKKYWSTIKEHVSKQQKQGKAKPTKRPATKKRASKKA